MKVLFYGDIVGGTGRKVVKSTISDLKKEFQIDFVIANAENSAGGLGLTYKIATELFAMGVDAITLGNHTWSKKEITNFIDGKMNIVRPYNYSGDLPGRGSIVITNSTGDKKLGIINLLGQVFMDPINSAFEAGLEALQIVKKETRAVIVDFHAEATSEKCALAWHLDGKVSAVIGTHTHVQTADERILPCGTACITDAGMTGPYESVIGMSVDKVLTRFVTQFPETFEPAAGPGLLNAVVVEINEDTGKAVNIFRLNKVLGEIT